jgi:hypothetical protein
MPQHHDMRCPARKRAEATEATAVAGTCGSEVVLGQREGVEHDGHITEAVRASARGALRLLHGLGRRILDGLLTSPAVR